MHPSCPMGIQLIWASGASVYCETWHHRTGHLCPGALWRPVSWLRQSARRWPMKGKISRRTWKLCSQLTGLPWQGQEDRKPHLEKSQLLTDDPTLPLVVLTCVPSCPPKQPQAAFIAAPSPGIVWTSEGEIPFSREGVDSLGHYSLRSKIALTRSQIWV